MHGSPSVPSTSWTVALGGVAQKVALSCAVFVLLYRPVVLAARTLTVKYRSSLSDNVFTAVRVIVKGALGYTVVSTWVAPGPEQLIVGLIVAVVANVIFEWAIAVVLLWTVATGLLRSVWAALLAHESATLIGTEGAAGSATLVISLVPAVVLAPIATGMLLAFESVANQWELLAGPAVAALATSSVVFPGGSIAARFALSNDLWTLNGEDSALLAAIDAPARPATARGLAASLDRESSEGGFVDAKGQVAFFLVLLAVSLALHIVASMVAKMQRTVQTVEQVGGAAGAVKPDLAAAHVTREIQRQGGGTIGGDAFASKFPRLAENASMNDRKNFEGAYDQTQFRSLMKHCGEDEEQQYRLLFGGGAY